MSEPEGPKIETERLLLRPLLPEDADAFTAMMAEPAVAKFLAPDGSPPPYGTAWRGFASMLGHWRIRGYGMFAMIEKSTGEWVGRTGPWMPGGWPALECGWGVAPSRWGMGYAPEAAVAAIRWTFARFPDLDRMISLIDPANGPSQAVARKVGEVETDEEFLYEGKVRLKIWAAGRRQWLDRFGE